MVSLRNLGKFRIRWKECKQQGATKISKAHNLVKAYTYASSTYNYGMTVFKTLKTLKKLSNYY